MAPTRTPKSKYERAEGTSNKAGPSNHKEKKKHSSKEPNALPGVQKIKSMLRQARRLLAKDKLAADVKVATERRVKSLEAELAQAETARKERNMATKYHKVKFFERQKVTRKLNQNKKRLASASGTSKSELESSLHELRVDLNYILHYPKAKRYISLFPPEAREHTSDAPAPNVNPQAEEVRSWIRKQMESGALPAEPELTLDARQHQPSQKSTTTLKSEWTEKKSKTKDPATKAAKESEKKAEKEKDDFFEDDEEEQEESNDSGSDSSDSE